MPVQVESLRQLGDAAGTQLGATQARLEQLQAAKEQQEQQLRAQLQAAEVSPNERTGCTPSSAVLFDMCFHCQAQSHPPPAQQK